AKALAAGNNLSYQNGTAYAFNPDGPAYSSMPAASSNPMGAAALTTMLSGPFAGIFGGIAYASGGSDATAYTLGQIGVATDGILASAAGYQLPKSPYIGLPGTTSTLAENNAYGKAAEIEAIGSFRGQGLSVQGQVTLTDGSVRCVADCAINGVANAPVQVPSGFIAVDLNGNALVDLNGQPI
ncbi:hypothetical protein QMO17_36710, partial [Klebsiella pneumoniae]|nr:hypothetical protein [Klebsiella pneumoniae]